MFDFLNPAKAARKRIELNCINRIPNHSHFRNAIYTETQNILNTDILDEFSNLLTDSKSEEESQLVSAMQRRAREKSSL